MGQSFSELTYHSPGESVALLLRTTLSLLRSYAPGVRQEASLPDLECQIRRTIDDLEQDRREGQFEPAFADRGGSNDVR